MLVYWCVRLNSCSLAGVLYKCSSSNILIFRYQIPPAVAKILQFSDNSKLFVKNTRKLIKGPRKTKMRSRFYADTPKRNSQENMKMVSRMSTVLTTFAEERATYRQRKNYLSPKGAQSTLPPWCFQKEQWCGQPSLAVESCQTVVHIYRRSPARPWEVVWHVRVPSPRDSPLGVWGYRAKYW